MKAMTIVFVDWAPIEHKSDIKSGIQIRRYYAWVILNKLVKEIIPFRKENGNINFKALRFMFKKESKIWVEYGCGRIAHLVVMLISFLRSKKIIVNVHDFVIQEGYIGNESSFFRKVQLQIIERLLLKRSSVIILAAPGLLNWYTPKRNQKILIMMPGVGDDELFPSKNKVRSIMFKKKAIYFGSMRRKGIIPHIIDLFSKLDGWELLLVGEKEGANIEERKNVRYIGVVSHDKIQDILEEADVILLSLPKTEYFDKATPTKLAYALKSCKPIIATRLKGISVYVSKVGLENNVIFVDNWDSDTLKDALQKAQNLNINAQETIEIMKTMAWEPRFRKAINIALDTNQRNNFEIEWV